jgi:hypothetical protein
MIGRSLNRFKIAAIILALGCLLLLTTTSARGETFVAGKVLTSDGKVVTSGAVALEKGELHNNVFLSGSEIQSDGTFKIPLPSGGPWGLHVYSEGYIYFPLQIQITAGTDNEIPVILPLDGNTGDDPRISNIRFTAISDQVFRVSMMVDDPDRNLGPQMLAIDTKRYKSYRMLPAKGDVADKKANFPVGEYQSPFIPVALQKENLGDWLFVVADHKCSNGTIYNGQNQSVFKPPIAHAEPMQCDVPGIWKSNFDKIYRFTLQSPGVFKGEQFEGRVIIDRMIQEENKIHIEFRFQGDKGKAELRLVCRENDVKLKGSFAHTGSSGDWIFSKLKNEKRAQKGQELFEVNCAICHYHDRVDTKVGPGFKGLFKNPTLPSGRPTLESTVRDQIINGGGKMPPFKHLKDEETAAILDYLKSL